MKSEAHNIYKNAHVASNSKSIKSESSLLWMIEAYDFSNKFFRVKSSDTNDKFTDPDSDSKVLGNAKFTRLPHNALNSHSLSPSLLNNLYPSAQQTQHFSIPITPRALSSLSLLAHTLPALHCSTPKKESWQRSGEERKKEARALFLWEDLMHKLAWARARARAGVKGMRLRAHTSAGGRARGGKRGGAVQRTVQPRCTGERAARQQSLSRARARVSPSNRTH